MAVELRSASALGRGLSRALRTDAIELLRLLRLETCELSVVLVGDRAMRRLNRDFRGVDEATDVLSFPQLDHRCALRRRRKPAASRTRAAASPPLALGDVVISVDTAVRQARILAVRPVDRMRTLLIHGTLHLVGYDHESSPADARRMFARERELARRLGTIVRSDPLWPPVAMPPAQGKCSVPKVTGRASDVSPRR